MQQQYEILAETLQACSQLVRAMCLRLPVIEQRLHFVESFQLKDEKSVSRQHLTLTVSPVKPGDGVSTTRDPSLDFPTDCRSRLYILDQRSQSKMKPQSLVRRLTVPVSRKMSEC